MLRAVEMLRPHKAVVFYLICACSSFGIERQTPTLKAAGSNPVRRARKGQISLEICPFQLNPPLRVGEILLRNMKYAFSVLNRCGDGWI